jgi:hypothetical protein
MIFISKAVSRCNIFGLFFPRYQNSRSLRAKQYDQISTAVGECDPLCWSHQTLISSPQAKLWAASSTWFSRDLLVMTFLRETGGGDPRQPRTSINASQQSKFDRRLIPSIWWKVRAASVPTDPGCAARRSLTHGDLRTPCGGLPTRITWEAQDVENYPLAAFNQI